VLQVGFLFTYIAPLAFVLSITMLKEAIDDFARYRRDAEANSTIYTRLTPHGPTHIASSDIQVPRCPIHCLISNISFIIDFT
jgi:phospholipid-translocating ATPase